MGDGFKLWVQCLQTITFLLTKLDFKVITSCQTGEVFNLPQTADCGSLSFRLFQNKGVLTLEIAGNFYKLLKKECNSGDFSYVDLYKAIQILVNEYRINPFTARVVNFELGPNLRLGVDYSVKEILDSIVCYQGKAAVRDNFNGKGDYYRFDQGEFSLKIYDKGQHCLKSQSNILRIELKAVRNRLLRDAFGITHLIDLLDVDKLHLMSQYLVKRLNYFIVYERSIDLKVISEKDREFLLRYKDQHEWGLLWNTNAEKHRKVRNRFNKLVCRQSGRNLIKELQTLVEQKGKTLLACRKEEDALIKKEIIQWATSFQ